MRRCLIFFSSVDVLKCAQLLEGAVGSCLLLAFFIRNATKSAAASTASQRLASFNHQSIETPVLHPSHFLWRTVIPTKEQIFEQMEMQNYFEDVQKNCGLDVVTDGM